MVDVETLHLAQITLSVLSVAQAEVAEGEHIEAVDAVLRVERVVPDEKVGQRYGKIVHRYVVEQMLFAVVHEFEEQTARLVLLA